MTKCAAASKTDCRYSAPGAGLILLAKEAEGGKVQLGTMDIVARRNAYGRQLGSFSTTAEMKGVGEVPMVFIRAPYITSVSGSTEVLAEVDGKIVAAREGSQLVTAFHPELTEDTRCAWLFPAHGGRGKGVTCSKR